MQQIQDKLANLLWVKVANIIFQDKNALKVILNGLDFLTYKLNNMTYLANIMFCIRCRSYQNKSMYITFHYICLEYFVSCPSVKYVSCPSVKYM